MAEQEEDFSKLPLPDRFVHKIWKVRKEGYEAAAKEFEKTPDESDPTFRPFLNDASLWKGAAGDSNVAAQQEGLAALCAFLKYGGQSAASRSRSQTVVPIYEKGLSSTRPAAKANAVEALLLYVELDRSDLLIEEMLPSLSHKQPKVIAASLSAITTIFHSFGIKIVEPKPILKLLPKVFGHADKNVRAEATNLTVELYRWLKEAMKAVFWTELKPVQQQDLEKMFEKVKEEPPPRQERLTRSQQAAQAIASTKPTQNTFAEEEAEEVEEEAAEIDAFDLAEPVDVNAKLPTDFYELVNSSKWKDRKEALDALFNVLNTPRIKDGAYDEMVRVFAKCMKDANIAVVTVAANCVEKLAMGLRKSFTRYKTTIVSPMMERFKEKKQSVADALGAGLDAVVASTSLSECLEEILSFLPNKNPQVKVESIKLVIRCLRSTRDVPSKSEQKLIADAGLKQLTESTEAMRSGGAEILGTLMKIIGERAMAPHLDGLDDMRKTKIKEYFDTAEVKAKEKPKVVAPPAKTAGPAAGGKKVASGGKKLTAKPTASATAPTADRFDESAAPSAKPTAKTLSKPGSAPKSALAPPGGSKLGGLKKPSGTAAAAASPQRRVMSPPVGYDEDEGATASPSKFGLGRGGLAARPLSRPAAPSSNAGPTVPVSNGMSAVERMELEELRSERDRLTALAESLRGSNAKLTAEISELQNQNAQLIEDHTRDVLQIKAKETQLVRARGECEVLRAEMDSLRKETDRYKREVSRLGRESIDREREELLRGRQMDEGPSMSGENGIYEDQTTSRYNPAHTNGNAAPSRTNSSLMQRTGSASSVPGSRPAPTKLRSQGLYGSGVVSPSEEKENNGLDAFSQAARRKISPPIGQSSTFSSGRSSPQRPAMSREISGVSDGQSGRDGTENWKRAAEVTSQLKARIEAMKARQGLNRP